MVLKHVYYYINFTEDTKKVVRTVENIGMHLILLNGYNFGIYKIL